MLIVFYAKSPHLILTTPLQGGSKEDESSEKDSQFTQHLELLGSSEDHPLLCRTPLRGRPQQQMLPRALLAQEHIFLDYPSHSTKLYLLPVKSTYLVFHTVLNCENNIQNNHHIHLGRMGSDKTFSGIWIWC